jgi:hypothetical protein
MLYYSYLKNLSNVVIPLKNWLEKNQKEMKLEISAND